MVALAPNLPTTHASDGYRTGMVMDAVYGNGSPVSPVFVYDFAPAATCLNNIALSQTPSGGITSISLSAGIGNTSITYKSYTGVIALDSPRAISISGVTSTISSTFIVYGWDVFGVPMSESIAGPTGATTVYGKKAFAYIRQITSSGSTTQPITVGTSDIYGLPYVCRSQNYVRAAWNGYDDYYIPATSGIATLASGTVAVACPSVKADSVIIVNYAVATSTTANRGFVNAKTSKIVPGAGFIIDSTNASDTSIVYWQVVDKSDYAGSVTLASGTATVTTTAITANSLVLVTLNTPSTQGYYSYGTITAGTSFVITSSNAGDASTVNWQIINTNFLAANSPINVGQVTLASGTATVNNYTVQKDAGGTGTVSNIVANANSVILLAPSSLGAGTGGFLSVSATTDAASFVITSLDTSGTHTADVSVVNYMVLNAPTPTFKAPDFTTATTTTGDVRGTYKPSSPSDGIKRLSISMYVRGSDPIADNYGVENDDDDYLENVVNLAGVTQA